MTTAVAPAPRVRARSRDRKRLYIVAVIIAAAIAFLLWRGLSNATMYFRTADEAAAQRASLGTKRFRIEGTVVPGTIKDDGRFTDFSITSKGSTVAVQNDGQPLGIFQPNIPVVLEGHFASSNPANNLFESDQIMVKHSSDYDAKHPDRVSGADNQ
jgi:cytochrome c-type biogenesis protein CcmE